MDQVVTLAAVNQSASLVINLNLVTGMIEVAKLRKSVEETVNNYCDIPNLPKLFTDKKY